MSLLPAKLWNITTPNPFLQVQLSNELNIHPVVAQLLVNRGILTCTEAKSFLSADFSHLHDPFCMKDMDKAVARIRQAGENQEKVMIFGDYDVDGVTSSALLHNTLKKVGLDVINHIPHRMTDGYGLNETIAPIARGLGVKLLIAVDCGITAFSEVELLNTLGIDVIIFDHHEPAERGLPSAVAIVNPKRQDCTYPFKHLASVGLMAKLTQALLGEIPDDIIDLVTLGTIADVVQLRGENRLFVKNGLLKIGQTKNKGLSALMETSRIKGKKFRTTDVGFILGPRINATGRMDSAKKSLELLLCDDEKEAIEIAQFLENMNADRQKLQRTTIQEALSLIEQEINFKDHKVIVLSKEGWHKGVLGIVASRVSEMYYRPAIVISMNDGVGTASARSIEGFHLHEALTHCAAILENYGGHKLAAGLTIRSENIDRFKQVINEFAKDLLCLEKLLPSLEIDCDIPLSYLNFDFLNQINQLEPYGEGNPEPIFCTRQLTVKNIPSVVGKDTLKFWVSDGSQNVPVVGFGMGKYRELIVPQQKIDLAYQIIIDDWNKEPMIQLKMKDVRESGQ